MNGMITGSNSGEVTQVIYAEQLPSWTTTELLASLAWTRTQLLNAHLGTFAEESELRDFQLGITTELDRRGVAFPD